MMVSLGIGRCLLFRSNLCESDTLGIGNYVVSLLGGVKGRNSRYE